uniref:PCI domain-containing protein n=1 Tax=Leptocylindrus danicus TaxID=163516 RepID=A0A7S2KT83_9STRA
MSSSMDVDDTKAPTAEKKKENEEEEEEEKGVNMMELAQTIHRLNVTGIDDAAKTELRNTILSELKNPFLFKTTFPDEVEVESSETASAIAKLEVENEAKKKELEESIATAREEAGDMEVLESSLKLAKFSFQSLSKDEALEAYRKVVELPKLSSGKKIDVLMERARVASFYGDTKLMAELVDTSTKMAGDWDRRNRLKVYEALGKILMRDVKAAAALLVDCIATFSCTEFCTFKDFVVYAMVSNLLHLPRTQLKEKIIDGPEILAIVNEIPVVSKLVNSLYDCDYKAYLHAMVEVESVLVADRFLQPHCGYIMRELHVLGYKQFLDSYKSVTLDSMAASFGVGVEFLDLQVSRFIAAGRLTAKIDKFGGIVETTRPDLKNSQYKDMIHKGDNLLNRIQKLARVVDL